MAMSTTCYSIVGGVGACEDKSGSVLFPSNVYNREGRVNREGVELNEPTLTHDLSASSHIGDCGVRGVWSWLGQAWFVWLLNRIPTRWGKGRHLYESGWGLKGGWGPLLSLFPYMFWEWNFWNWRLTTIVSNVSYNSFPIIFYNSSYPTSYISFRIRLPTFREICFLFNLIAFYLSSIILYFGHIFFYHNLIHLVFKKLEF